MRKILQSILLFLMVVPMKAAKKPNVIIVLSDDQGYGDFSCHGNPVLQTPALDKLHGESLRFSNFHVSPYSTPTRGQLLTGLDAMHNKASAVLSGCCMMRRDIVTMPEVFSQNGYKTGIFGKWHLGENYPDRPMDRGFDKCVWFKGWGLLSETEFDNDYYRTRYLDSLSTVQSEKYCSDLWFDKSMEWMEEQVAAEQPFFSYISLNNPHGPFNALRDDYMAYCKNLDEKTASFFGMIKNIDENMERLDTWLAEKGIKDNTIVVFMNDNGGTGGISVYNANMRGEKGSIYDGGHRAACFFRWPGGNLMEPATINYPSNVQDLLPTFIDLLDFNIEQGTSFDGISLKPVLTGQEGDNERMFVVQQGSHVNPVKYNSCVVYKNWRLVGENELYNLENDPSQTNNVASQNTGIANKMKSYYENWWLTVYDANARHVPLMIGTAQTEAPILTSSDWVGSGPNTQWAVALGNDDPNGYWVVDAEVAGKYKLELRRWPFHINKKLTERGPSAAVGGTSIRSGKALEIASGSIQLNGGTPVKAQAAADSDSIIVEINIPAGVSTLKAFFNDKEGTYLCGAYYLKVEKVL